MAGRRHRKDADTATLPERATRTPGSSLAPAEVRSTAIGSGAIRNDHDKCTLSEARLSTFQ